MHIAVIMDGNGRWANKKLLPRAVGYRKGVESAREIVKACMAEGVTALTLFAFSSENWKRPEHEVSLLMSLLNKLLVNEVASLNEHGIRLSVVGDVEALAPALQDAIYSAEQSTQHNDKLRLNIALNYGGRWDILQAAKKVCDKVQSGEITSENVSEAVFASQLCLSDLPDPDLMIRTSGEYRVSNFLLWQFAYTEFYFTDTYWPDFNKEELKKAIQFFHQRQRRFGQTSAQLEMSQEHV